MRTPLAVSMLTLVLALGCGSSGGTGGTGGNGGGGGTGGTTVSGAPAGVAGSTLVSEATDAEKVKTCDWYAGLVGGYGADSTCSSADLNAPPTQADCIATFPTCAVTVSDFAACVVAVVNAQIQCTDTSVKDAEMSATCASVVSANCFGATN